MPNPVQLSLFPTSHVFLMSHVFRIFTTLDLIYSDVLENDLSVGKFTEKQKIVYNAVLRANR